MEIEQKENKKYHSEIPINSIVACMATTIIFLFYYSLFGMEKIWLVIVLSTLIILAILFSTAELKKNHNLMETSFLAFLLINLYFLGKITLKTNLIVIICYWVYLFIATINKIIEIENKKSMNHIKFTEGTIIMLTVVTLFISYPLIQPKVDIKSIGQIDQAYYNYSKTYAHRSIELTITPPALQAIFPQYACTKIHLADEFYHSPYIINYMPDLEISSDKGTMIICTNSKIDFSPRIVTLGFNSNYKIMEYISNQDIDRFWWISADNNSTRMAEISINNPNKEFPLRYDSFELYITNNTMFDQNERMFDYLDKGDKQCKLRQFKIKYHDGYRHPSIKFEDDKYILNMNDFYINIEPTNYSVMQVMYDINKECETTENHSSIIIKNA